VDDLKRALELGGVDVAEVQADLERAESALKREGDF
jgi:hypothetical protein